MNKTLIYKLKFLTLNLKYNKSKIIKGKIP